MRKRQTLASQLTERIYSRILRHRLAPGDHLGTERALADDFGVSYGIMRESIGRLRALGIVSARQRKGLVIEEPAPFDAFGRILPLIASEEQDLRQLLDFRIAIETGALEWAVERADEKILAQMEETLAPLERLQRAGRIAEATRYDYQFHSLLLDASGNDYLSSLHGVISQYFNVVKKRYPSLYMRADPEHLEDHRKLVAALRAHDRQLAADILRHHLRFPLDLDSQKERSV